MRSYVVILDGVMAGKIRRGGKLEISVVPGNAEISLASGNGDEEMIEPGDIDLEQLVTIWRGLPSALRGGTGGSAQMTCRYWQRWL